MKLKITPREENKFISPKVEIDGIRGKCIKKSSRFTYKFPEMYFKIDYETSPNTDDTHGICEHTLDQIKCWKKFKNTKYEQFLCPIIVFGTWKQQTTNFSWILQPVCERKYISRSKYKDLMRNMNLMGICDMREEQLGYYKDRLVCFDYGYWNEVHR